MKISCEFYPPQTAEGLDKLRKTATILSGFNPQFYSVTFGAGGSTRKGTLETVARLQREMTTDIAPHLSCIGLAKSDILEILVHYQQTNIRRLIIVRGDLPSGMMCQGEIQYASELVNFVREKTGDFFHIDVAAYPEVHPQALNAKEDLENFKRKIDAGANSAITQFFFNADAYFYFLDECARVGVNVPIVPGVMPITQLSRLVRFCDLCGAEIPRWIRKRLEHYGDDVVSLQAFGIEVIVTLCERLKAGGAPGFHFYTLNKAHPTAEIINQLMKE